MKPCKYSHIYGLKSLKSKERGNQVCMYTSSHHPNLTLNQDVCAQKIEKKKRRAQSPGPSSNQAKPTKEIFIVSSLVTFDPSKKKTVNTSLKEEQHRKPDVAKKDANDTRNSPGICNADAYYKLFSSFATQFLIS
jgi:hypothetical protein